MMIFSNLRKRLAENYNDPVRVVWRILVVTCLSFGAMEALGAIVSVLHKFSSFFAEYKNTSSDQFTVLITSFVFACAIEIAQTALRTVHDIDSKVSKALHDNLPAAIRRATLTEVIRYSYPGAEARDQSRDLAEKLIGLFTKQYEQVPERLRCHYLWMMHELLKDDLPSWRSSMFLRSENTNAGLLCPVEIELNMVKYLMAMGRPFCCIEREIPRDFVTKWTPGWWESLIPNVRELSPGQIEYVFVTTEKELADRVDNLQSVTTYLEQHGLTVYWCDASKVWSDTGGALPINYDSIEMYDDNDALIVALTSQELTDVAERRWVDAKGVFLRFADVDSDKPVRTIIEQSAKCRISAKEAIKRCRDGASISALPS
jgi:hypothetical protein